MRGLFAYVRGAPRRRVLPGGGLIHLISLSAFTDYLLVLFHLVVVDVPAMHVPEN